jgi:hypothetical protein
MREDGVGLTFRRTANGTKTSNGGSSDGKPNKEDKKGGGTRASVNVWLTTGVLLVVALLL